MVIGGIAIIARGVRRFTADIDAAIRGDKVKVDALLAALEPRQIVPRIADAAQFAEENLVLLLRHKPSGVELDVSLAWTEFEHEAIAAATIATFGSVKAPMASPADLVVFKAIAGRGKDIDDVTALLVLYPKLDLSRIRKRVNELARLAEAPELAQRLEGVIAASRTQRTARRGSTNSRPRTGSTPRRAPKRKRKRMRK
jgi:hypothetical protein